MKKKSMKVLEFLYRRKQTDSRDREKKKKKKKERRSLSVR